MDELEHIGSKSKAICQSCVEIVTTTGVIWDVPLSDGSGVVEDCQCYACDKCGTVVSTKHDKDKEL